MRYELTRLGVLSITGDKAKTFLQGQLTCDLEKITSFNSILGAHCNPKGRIISLFSIINHESAYLLVMPQHLLEVTVSALKKYAVFFKVMIEDVSSHWQIYGYDNLSEADSSLNSLPISLLSDRIIQLKAANSSEAANSTLAPAHSDTMGAWIGKNIVEGIPVIYPETSGKLLPQELNLDAHGAISYDKGCYTGQEIIARMHYRGKAKSRVYQCTVVSESPIHIGDLIYTNTSEPRECGIVLEICSGTAKALAVLNDADATDTQLFIHHPTDNLTIHSEE